MVEVEGDLETAVAFAELFAPEVPPPGLEYHSRSLFSNMTCRDHIYKLLVHNGKLDILSFSFSLHSELLEVVMTCSSTIFENKSPVFFDMIFLIKILKREPLKNYITISNFSEKN